MAFPYARVSGQQEGYLSCSSSRIFRYGSFKLDSRITGEPDSCDLDLTSLIKHYMSESDNIVKIHSGISGWVAIRTPSPRVDQSKAKLIIDGLAALNKDLTIKRVKLNQKYLAEKLKYFHYFKGTVSEEFIDKLFKNVSELITQLPYDANDIAVEITPDKSIFFEIRFQEIILHFKLIISNPLAPMAFFAMHKNSACLDNGVGSVNDILNHLSAITHDGLSSRIATEEAV